MAWAILLGSSGLAHADDEGTSGNNHVVAVNETDDRMIGKFKLDIARVREGVADNENGALAYSRCARCQTVAGAVQIVLVFSTSIEIRTLNEAIAINDQCTDCRSLASAYQFVRVTDGPVSFTEAGQDAIERIREDGKDIVKSGMSIDRIQADLAALMVELDQVLDQELRPRGGEGDREKDEDVERD